MLNQTKKDLSPFSTVRRRLFLSAVSGFLLTLAFPRWNLWPLAWIALIPLFYSLDQARNRKEAFLFGFTAGFVFFLLSISWLRHVTVFGLFFVAAILAVYWGVFGILYYTVIARQHSRQSRSNPEIASAPSAPRNDELLLLSASWVALEFIRSELPVWGFGWNLLGTSQAPNLWVAQLASVGGVYSVSFLVVLGNAVIYSLRRVGSAFLFALLLVAVLVFGWSRIESFNPQSFLRVSVLQGNIPQLLKWDAAYKRKILRVYLNLTELAGFDVPQMILWPEAAFPGFFNQDPLARRVKERVRKIKIPVLVGSPHAENGKYYNSVYLWTPSPLPLPLPGGEDKGEGEARIIQRYDKIRLVPFGEYVPWKPILGFLESYAYALGVSDFSPGRDFTVFELPLTPSSPPLRFSTLICFEDIFPGLARKFVDRGADFLVVVTNDAWFGRSSAPYQHLQASQFRAIETGVSIVRAANTGVSGFITPMGRVAGRVRNQEGKDTFVMGGMTYPVALAREKTFYRKGGWIFPWLCLAALIVSSLRGGIPKRGRSSLTVGHPERSDTSSSAAKPRGSGSFGPSALRMTLFFFLLLTTGCIRLQGGAFYAKKGGEGEPSQLKEVYADTDKLRGRETGSPGKIEV